MFKTTQAIKSLARGGVNLAVGQPVTPQAFTPEHWARLVAEGVVVEIVTDEAPPVSDYKKDDTGHVEVEATGAALRLAIANGIDLANHSDIGTGQDGRITLSDVKGLLNA